MLDAAELVADAVDGVEVIGVDAQDLGARVRGDVDEVVGGQAVVDRHEHRADLRHGVERLELLVRVRRDVGDTVALLHAHPLQGRRPAVAAIEELLVGEAQVAVDDGLAVRRTASATVARTRVVSAGSPCGLLPYELSIRAKSAVLMPPTNALCALGSSSTDRSYTNA